MRRLSRVTVGASQPSITSCPFNVFVEFSNWVKGVAAPDSCGWMRSRTWKKCMRVSGLLCLLLAADGCPALGFLASGCCGPQTNFRAPLFRSLASHSLAKLCSWAPSLGPEQAKGQKSLNPQGRPPSRPPAHLAIIFPRFLFVPPFFLSPSLDLSQEASVISPLHPLCILHLTASALPGAPFFLLIKPPETIIPSFLAALEGQRSPVKHPTFRVAATVHRRHDPVKRLCACLIDIGTWVSHRSVLFRSNKAFGLIHPLFPRSSAPLAHRNHLSASAALPRNPEHAFVHRQRLRTRSHQSLAASALGSLDDRFAQYLLRGSTPLALLGFKVAYQLS
ncbi:hypothetical protein N657DRAFT_428814 [Parathielavia appendiculata]|uniref:Transmembrane protein n=1 Tax=Parathielavia appendiculata TaxID=2587402 RepID=A0AAN6U0P4_9PEZI|nr:hypothetical protein N657DRAFT_428814 [Parathielavia appendiculata]